MKKSADTTFKAPVFGKRTKFLIAAKEWSKLENAPHSVFIREELLDTAELHLIKLNRLQPV